jgi:hypothetical protein
VISSTQIATLHLQLPDPPALAKSPPVWSEVIDLARQLHTSGLLKADWDPAKHPRWPAGSPGGVGGEFGPDGVSSSNSSSGQAASVEGEAGRDASVIPVQITIPAPFELPIPPFPSEIVPAPVIPNINPRDLPENPYPDRPECKEEWAEATDYCLKLKARNLLGKGDYSGSGRTVSQCIRGRVSQECGGNSTGA